MTNTQTAAGAAEAPDYVTLAPTLECRRRTEAIRQRNRALYFEEKVKRLEVEVARLSGENRGLQDQVRELIGGAAA